MIKLFIFTAKGTQMKMNGLILCIILLAVIAGFAAGRYFKTPRTQKGDDWESRKFGDTYIVSVKNHKELVSALTDFVKNERITAGTISGIGAVNRAVLRFFDPATKQYVDKTFEGQMEITNLTGNISTMDGKEYLHLHITLGNSAYQGIAGHLLSADISGAGEFSVQPFPFARLERTFSPEVGLNFYDFDK